ncbi:MAG TPA: hypothetical protein VEX86_26490 [Longimicrobium sp.]|nr:hypothetical protein [Longimicrobium sp.]
MSLLGFQRALSDLAASPALVQAVRGAGAGAAALAAYELTSLETRRLAAVAGQRGMAVNCTLYRSNRLGSILQTFPLTSHLLEGRLREVADRFFAAHPTPAIATRRELRRFSAFVLASVEEGWLDVPFLAEVMLLEQAQYDLALLPRRLVEARAARRAAHWPDGPVTPHPMVRVVRFGHDPSALFPLLLRKAPAPYEGVPAGEFHLLLDLRGGVRRVTLLDAASGRLLGALQDGAAADATEALEPFLAAGLLVRTIPRKAAKHPQRRPEMAAAA